MQQKHELQVAFMALSSWCGLADAASVISTCWLGPEAMYLLDCAFKSQAALYALHSRQVSGKVPEGETRLSHLIMG